MKKEVIQMTTMQKLQAQMQAKRKGKKGFTLVELVVVIAILAILAAIAIPVVSSIIGTANSNVDTSNAKSLELAIKEANTKIAAGIALEGSIDGTSTVSAFLATVGLDTTVKTAGNKFLWNTTDHKVEMGTTADVDATHLDLSDAGTLLAECV